MSEMTPREIVHELDKHIIGQTRAKRAVAIALRNRWRRVQLDDELRREITPKNILMIGPTGVGKTEIARRLARLAGAPFIKVEATKFTEVGYVGRDVESIIRDLVDVAISMARARATEKVRHRAEAAAEERLLDVLLPGERRDGAGTGSETREKFRKLLREGRLDEREVEVEVNTPQIGVEIMAPPGMEEMTSQLQGLFQNLGSGRTRTRSVAVKEAMRLLAEEEATKLVDDEELKARALRDTEENAIVFLDEIDKVARRSEYQGSDVSREGVQRDLLPLVEGSTVNTRYGMVRTDHILFIASGAFHVARPSDLIPELQGRLPIRVELDALRNGGLRPDPDRARRVAHRAVRGPDGDRGGAGRVRGGRGRAHRGDRVAGERAYREHRRPPAAHGHGAAPGVDLLRGARSRGRAGGRGRRLRGPRARRAARERGPDPLHPVAGEAKRGGAARGAADEHHALRLRGGRGARQVGAGRRGVLVGGPPLRPDERPHVVRPAPDLEAIRDPRGPAPAGERVLDLAGGTGDLARLALAQGAGEVVVADVNPSMLEAGRDRLLDRVPAGRLRFVAADAERLPFAPGSFDCVLRGSAFAT